MPDRTNQGVDAAGRPTADYGKTIAGNSEGESFDKASVERGRQLLSQIPSGSVDTAKKNTEMLVSPTYGSITVPNFNNQRYRDMITKNDYVPYVVGILAPSQFDPDLISVHVGSPTSIILYDMEGKPTGTIDQFDANSTIELLNKPKQFANGYWGVPTKDGRNYVLLVSIDNLRNVMSNELNKKLDVGQTGWLDKNTKEGAWVKEIRETLKEINPETLENAVTISETFINLVPEGQTKTTLQGIHGAIILDMIRQAWHNLNIINNKVTIEPKPGVDIVNLQTKLQTLVNTGRLSIDTLKTGLLYSSPIFKDYSELKMTKGMIDPSVNAKDFLEYVNNRQKTWENSPDIRSLIASASMLEWVNFTQAIKWFQDLGQISPWLTQNPGTVHAVGAGVTNINATTQNTPSVWWQVNNTTITWSISQDGVTWWKVSSTLSMAGQGVVQGFGDIMKLWKGDPIATLGIGAALFYGVYKMFKQFGFLGGIAGFLGLWAINNWEKIGDNLSGLWDVAKKTAAKVEEGIDHLRWKTWSSASPDKPAESSEKPAEVTEDQKYLREQTLQNTALSGKIDQLSDLQKKYNKPAIGKIWDYITYIETNLKDTPLTQIFPDDHKESIYYDTGKTPISVPPNLDSKMLKAVLRSYLGWSWIDSISGTWDTAGVVDKQKFMDTYGITPEDIKTKKLTDILSVIHQKRKVNAQPSNSPPSQAASPQSSPPSNSPPAAASVAPTNTWEKLVVGGLEIVKRMNVQIDKNAQVYDAQWNNMAANFLKKDPSGNTYLPKDEVVVVTSNTIKIWQDLYAEIEHTWTTMYIRVQNLKQITI